HDQAMEDLHRLLQLPAGGGHCGREDLLLPRWVESRSHFDGADPKDHATYGRARPGPTVRPALVRSRQGHHRLGRERSWGELHLWRRGGGKVPAEARPRSHLPGPPGGGGWVRILRQAPAGHPLLRSQLLRGVRQ
ncbi:hypothetical protein KR009_006968, partial [Drosophila setifemur]